jgi:hypothetical protein
MVPRPGAAALISDILVDKEESEVCINTYIIVTRYLIAINIHPTIIN